MGVLNILNGLADNFGLVIKKKTVAPHYPNVEDIIDDDMKFKKETIEALEDFKKLKPYRGTRQEKEEKFRKLNSALSKIYKMPEPLLLFCKRSKYGSCYFPFGHIIILEQQGKDKYGVITFLHEFRHAMGAQKEWHACKWSINLYKRVFPKSYAKLTPYGHLLYRPETIEKIKKYNKNIVDI